VVKAKSKIQKLKIQIQKVQNQESKTKNLKSKIQIQNRNQKSKTALLSHNRCWQIHFKFNAVFASPSNSKRACTSEGKPLYKMQTPILNHMRKDSLQIVSSSNEHFYSL